MLSPPADVIGSPTLDLAQFIVGLDFVALPGAVVEAATQGIIDGLGCAIAGVDTRRGRMLRDLAPTQADGMPIFGGRKRTTVLEAVFVNAMTTNFLEMDDTYDRRGSIMFAHPGATIVPVALALAEAKERSGRELIEAVVAGYEVCLRVGAAIQPTRKRAMEEVWGCATFQTFGAIATAAKLLKLDLSQTMDALGIGGGTAPVSSTLKVWREDRGDFHNGYGWAAQAGTRAAMMASLGYTGPHDILDGNNGFWRMYGSDQCDFPLFTAGLDSHWLTLDLSFKPWSACRWEHPLMDAARQLSQAHKIDFPDVASIASVDRIVARTFEINTRAPYSNRKPRVLLEGQFSAPFCVAAALLNEMPREGMFEDGAPTDPRVTALMEKVDLVSDDEANARFPGGGGDTLMSALELHMNGNVFTARVAYPKGDPRNPMSRSDITLKFLTVNDRFAAERGLESDVDRLWTLSTAPNITTLIAPFV